MPKKLGDFDKALFGDFYESIKEANPELENDLTLNTKTNGKPKPSPKPAGAPRKGKKGPAKKTGK